MNLSLRGKESVAQQGGVFCFPRRKSLFIFTREWLASADVNIVPHDEIVRSLHGDVVDGLGGKELHRNYWNPRKFT